VQPLFDAGQLRRNEIAMSVGDSRHFRLHEIMPRHFVESAAQAGMPATVVQAIFGELAADLPVDTACAGLAEDFPVELLRSISGGALQRLQRIMPTRATSH
jgi:serine/threonine-protein kinase HipA